MFTNLVTYHLYDGRCLPLYDAIAYQYVTAGNGVFIRTETRFFTTLLPITSCTIRGLAPLPHHFRLKVPRIPARLLDTILADARRARRPDGGLNEVLYQFHHHVQKVQVKKPAQEATATSVLASGMDDAAIDDASIVCDLHSHGNMRAFFSQTDNADEQGVRLYAVMGRLDSEPEMRLRLGVYGYWLSLPLTAVFTTNGPFKDLYQEKKDDKQRI